MKNAKSIVFFRFLMFLSIAFIGTKDYQLSFIIALIYGVLMHNFNQKKINEQFISKLEK